MITEQYFPLIEKAFGFALYDWQKDYLLGKGNRPYGRRQGKTFAYCLRLLLENPDAKPITKQDCFGCQDEHYDGHYSSWFRGFLRDIYITLSQNGFKTRLVKL